MASSLAALLGIDLLMELAMAGEEPEEITGEIYDPTQELE